MDWREHTLAEVEVQIRDKILVGPPLLKLEKLRNGHRVEGIARRDRRGDVSRAERAAHHLVEKMGRTLRLCPRPAKGS